MVHPSHPLIVLGAFVFLIASAYILYANPYQRIDLPKPEYAPQARMRMLWPTDSPSSSASTSSSGSLTATSSLSSMSSLSVSFSVSFTRSATLSATWSESHSLTSSLSLSPSRTPTSSLSASISPSLSLTSSESKSSSLSRSQPVSPSPVLNDKQIRELVGQRVVAANAFTNLPRFITVGDSILGRGDSIDKKFPCYSIASALYYNASRVHIIPNGGDMFRNKVTYSLKYLELANIPDNELVMFVDTFDVMLIRRPEPNEIVTKFLEMTNGDTNAIIISGECNCFPPSSKAACDRTDTMYKMPFRYVNSGQWLATAGTLLKLVRGIDECYRSKNGWDADQDVFQHFCFTDYHINAQKYGLRCVVDANSEIMRSTWEGGDMCPGHKIGQLVSINGHDDHMSVCRFNPNNKCATDPTTQGQPLTVHYNGKNPTTWAGLLDNYLSFNSFDPEFDKSDNLRFGCEKVARFEHRDGKDTIVESCEPFVTLCGTLLGLV